MRTSCVAMVILAAASATLGATIPGRRLNSGVYQYESLQLDTAKFFTPGQRFARDVQGQHTSGFKVPMRAYGRHFNLNLQPDHKINGINVNVVGEDGTVERMDTRGHFYFSGTVSGETGNWAHARLLDDGTIWGGFVSGGEGYHIEPSHYHPDAASEGNHIIYRLSDLEMYNPSNPQAKSAHFSPDINKFIPPADRERQPAGRQRRAIATYVAGKTACPVSLHADHTFYAGPGGGTSSGTLDQVFARWTTTQDVYDQYLTTGFSANPVNVQIGDLTIYKSKSGPGFNTITTTEGTPFLEKFSETDWSSTCLAHLLTDIDFDDGLLGLAWVGKTDSTPGGICQGVSNSKWTNTGFSTSTNHGSSVSTLLSGLVMAHEISHNFGSEHDSESGESAGTDALGRFLMWPLAIDGTDSNNDKFSLKSLGEINGVVAAKGGCFIVYEEQVCGNGIQELDEACDCGGAAGCDEIDLCCSTAEDCTLRAGKACSPSHLTNGVCCTAACEKEADTKVCREATECTKEVKCSDGVCDQVGGAKSDALLCQGGSRTCLTGSCSESICALWSMTECTLVVGSTDAEKASAKCVVACLDGGTCKSVDELGVTTNPYKTTDGGANTNANPGEVKQPANSPCDFIATTKDSGYCNADNKCVDGFTEGGIFGGLNDILNSFLDLAAIRDWLLREDVAGVPNYAWIIIGAVVLITLCACCCCKNAKKKNGAV